MDTSIELSQASIDAYLRLVALNLGSWQPEDFGLVAQPRRPRRSSRSLLEVVPCSPTLH